MGHPSDNVARVLYGLMFWSCAIFFLIGVVCPFAVDTIEWTFDIGGRRTGHADDVQ